MYPIRKKGKDEVGLEVVEDEADDEEDNENAGAVDVAEAPKENPEIVEAEDGVADGAPNEKPPPAGPLLPPNVKPPLPIVPLAPTFPPLPEAFSNPGLGVSHAAHLIALSLL